MEANKAQELRERLRKAVVEITSIVEQSETPKDLELILGDLGVDLSSLKVVLGEEERVDEGWYNSSCW